MNIVIPMAGKGRRFSESGYPEPKPLIQVKGKPMVWWAVQGLPQVPPERTIFIVHADHVRSFRIDSRLREIFSPEIRVLVQETPPAGQAATVLVAREEIDTAEPLLIHNCDTYAPAIAEELDRIVAEEPQIDGVIPVFPSSEADLSYVEIGRDGYATRVAEKEVISEHATVGTYHFSRGSDFVRAAEDMLKEGRRIRGEYYVLPAYQYLIDRGQRIRIAPLKTVHVLGTPAGAARFAADVRP